MGTMRPGGAPLPWSDARGLSRLLLHATPESRRAVALRLLEAADPAWWRLLAATVRSDDDWRLRARCLEVLGLAAGEADRGTAAEITAALTAPVDRCT
jgi:hypothetical protein